MRESWRSLVLLLVASLFSAALLEGSLRLFYFGSLVLPEFFRPWSMRQPYPTRG